MSISLDKALTLSNSRDLRFIKLSCASIKLNSRARYIDRHLLLVDYTLPVAIFDKPKKLEKAIDYLYSFIQNTCNITLPIVSQDKGSFCLNLITILNHKFKDLHYKVHRGSFALNNRFNAQLTDFQKFPNKTTLISFMLEKIKNENLLLRAREQQELRDSVYDLMHIAAIIITMQFNITERQKLAIFLHRRQIHLTLHHLS